jgi:putative endonuclease
MRSREAGLGAQEQGRTGFHCSIRRDTLVWFEAHESVEAAIRREKQIKEWKRAWKISLMESDNPRWIDLSTDLLR